MGLLLRINVALVVVFALGATIAGLAALLRLETELARFIGPVARHLVNRAAVRAADLDELLALLSREIESESGQRAFLSAAWQSLRLPRGRAS